MGDEVARIEIGQVSTSDEDLHLGTASLPLKDGDKVTIWSDMHLKYKGDVSLEYRMQVFRDGQGVVSLNFDPTDKNMTVGETRTEVMNKTNWKFSGRNGSLDIDTGGVYRFEAILIASENESLEVLKADIVLRQ